MKTLKVGLILVAAVMMLPPGVTSSQDKKVRLKDEAGLFSKEALERTQAIINDIAERHKKDLWIETYDKAPDKDLQAWVRERTQKLGVDGVYVVITNEPKRFQVQVGDATLKSGLFTRENLQELLKLLPGLAKDKDATLESIAKFTLETMNKNAKPVAAWPQLVGFWVGPEVAVKKTKTKGRVLVEFLEVDSLPFAKVGYQAQVDKKNVRESTGTYVVQLNTEKSQIVLKEFDADKDLVLSFELKGDMLKIKGSHSVQLTGVQGQANLTGTWQRLPKK